MLGLTLSTASGEAVALRNLVTTEAGFGPMVIDRKDQQRIITLQANVSGRDLGSVASDVEAALASVARPVGYDLLVAGAFEEQQSAFHELLVSLVLALALVYMVLSQYEIVSQPTDRHVLGAHGGGGRDSHPPSYRYDT
ncbi:MAG: efflux RND transporter permease subunit [Myxococcota bacterium]